MVVPRAFLHLIDSWNRLEIKIVLFKISQKCAGNDPKRKVYRFCPQQGGKMKGAQF
jgi:hypothetical protein